MSVGAPGNGIDL